MGCCHRYHLHLAHMDQFQVRFDIEQPTPDALQLVARACAQIVLRWLLQQDGVIALSRSTNPDRIAGNMHLFDFALSPAEMTAIHDLARDGSRIVDPPGLAPAWDPTPEAVFALAARAIS
jgi:diketogulonate reductase-like aldo/keto reductase